MFNHSNQQLLHLHKHYHYHYYDKESLHHPQGTIKNRATSPINMVTPKRTHENNSGILPTRSNWKSKLNPQIGQIYQQINNNNKKEKQICSNLLPKKEYTQNDKKSSKTILSFVQQQRQIKKIKNPLYSNKQDIQKQINLYQEYLKSVSRPNLYIPKGQRIKRLLGTTKRGQQEYNFEYFKQKQLRSTSTLASLNEQEQLLEISQKYKKINVNKQSINKNTQIYRQNDNNMQMAITTRPGLNMYSPTTKKTTIINEIIVDNNDDDDSGNNSEDVNKSVSEFVQTKEYKGMSEQYSSLLQQLQKQSSQLLLLSTPDYNNNNNNNQCRHDKKDYENNRLSYSYNLMRQQCAYLRDKFIQHISTTGKFIQNITTTTDGKCKCQ